MSKMQGASRTWDRPEALVAIVTTLFVVAPILSNRMVTIFGAKVLVGVFALILAYGVLDVINNNYGKEYARRAVVTAMVIRFIVWGLIALSLLLPTLKEPVGYQGIIGQSIRILLAGELAMLFSQYFVDIPIFHYLKGLNKRFWVRYNLSNATSHLISIATFTTLAFFGTGAPVLQLILGGYLFHIILGVVLTPVFSFINARIKQSQN